MKKILLVALVALVSLAAQAQAKIEFKSETIDYGQIDKGSDGLRVFEFTNTGDQPLVISDVKSSCGCTVPEKLVVGTCDALPCGSRIGVGTV